nr:hypothetical protein CFP56_67017 [Quercus suber]
MLRRRPLSSSFTSRWPSSCVLCQGAPSAHPSIRQDGVLPNPCRGHAITDQSIPHPGKCSPGLQVRELDSVQCTAVPLTPGPLTGVSCHLW